MTRLVNKYAICTGLLTLGLVAPAAAQSDSWEPERLSDGQPSIMGMWNNSRAVFTPLELPEELAGQELTAKELQARAEA